MLSLLATLVWWGSGRRSAGERRLVVVRTPAALPMPPREGSTVRILAWNIAHGRGDTEQGVLQNWLGGSREMRAARLRSIAEVLDRVDADVVILNEVDFDAGWSHGVNQAAFLSEEAGYPYRVEQRNFDFRVPFESWAFGNALLSRLPIVDTDWIDLPEHSLWERVVLGSKEAAVVRLDVAGRPLSVVPIHLEFRAGDTRSRAVPVLEELRAREPAPLVLAGDFNTAPPGWPAIGAESALGELLEAGWRGARAERPFDPSELTFPTFELRESRDWVLAEPPLEVVEEEVVEGAAALSDHAPVLAVIALPGEGGEAGAEAAPSPER